MPICRLFAIAVSCSMIASLAMGADATGIPMHRVLMTYWSNNTDRYTGYPMPGSSAPSGAPQANPEMQQQLDAINVLAYAFLHVDSAGKVYFVRPSVYLSTS